MGDHVMKGRNVKSKSDSRRLLKQADAERQRQQALDDICANGRYLELFALDWSGKCYEAAYRLQWARRCTTWRIVHALVRHESGISMGHAWVESRSKVYDLTMPAMEQPHTWDRFDYYHRWPIYQVQRYDQSAAVDSHNEICQYGPWPEWLEGLPQE